MNNCEPILKILFIFTYLYVCILFNYTLETENRALRNFFLFFPKSRNELIFIIWVSMGKRVSLNDDFAQRRERGNELITLNEGLL